MATRYEGGDQVTIKLAYDKDEITVWPSVEVPGGLVISLADSEEEHVNVGIASREEWEAIKRAGDEALALLVAGEGGR